MKASAHFSGSDTQSESILPLRLESVSVRKNGKYLLRDVSCILEDRGFTIVMGPNGAGKSTLLRLLHGLERPREGELVWSCPAEQVLQNQSFVFQTPILMRRTVQDNLAYPLMVRGVSRPLARKTAEEWAETVELKSQLHLEAQILSGGERQKLAVARALITKPDMLLLDEPTANLDGRSMKEIEAILLSARDASTRVVMATHDIGQAKRLASEVLFLNKGQLCEQTPAGSFFNTPETLAARAYLDGDILE